MCQMVDPNGTSRHRPQSLHRYASRRAAPRAAQPRHRRAHRCAWHPRHPGRCLREAHLSPEASSLSVLPTICFTLPWWMSMQGRKRTADAEAAAGCVSCARRPGRPPCAPAAVAAARVCKRCTAPGHVQRAGRGAGVDASDMTHTIAPPGAPASSENRTLLDSTAVRTEFVVRVPRRTAFCAPS